MSFLNLCVFHARSYYDEQFVKPYAPPSQFLDYARPLYDSCQLSKHDTNSHPDVISTVSRLKQLEHEMKNYRESMDNMTSTLIDQFSKLIKGHEEITMRVLHETNLRVGPTTSEGVFWAILSPLTLLTPKFKLIHIYPTLTARKTLCYLILECASSVTTSISMNTPKDV